MDCRSMLIIICIVGQIGCVYPLYLDTQKDCLEQIIRLGVQPKSKPLRLHLGCGVNHLDGYINVDFPLEKHTIQEKSGADVFADVTQLFFPAESVDEIRLHHLFEHFDRMTALGLLCRWHVWLKVGGVLCIETPDFERSIRLILDNKYNFKQKQSTIRHIFGSHEAFWAYHRDGWYKEKFDQTLTTMGFSALEYKFSQWRSCPNIVVKAKKVESFDRKKLIERARLLLSYSMVDGSATERHMLELWSKGLDEFLSKNF